MIGPEPAAPVRFRLFGQEGDGDVHVDVARRRVEGEKCVHGLRNAPFTPAPSTAYRLEGAIQILDHVVRVFQADIEAQHVLRYADLQPRRFRSEEHTSELQSLMRTSYAVFCLKKTTHTTTT